MCRKGLICRIFCKRVGFSFVMKYNERKPTLKMLPEDSDRVVLLIEERKQEVMNEDSKIKQLEKLCMEYGLGMLCAVPQPVSGGLLHTMYRVETEFGIYAIKVLNGEIMQRPLALRNMVNSEKVSHALELMVPVVAAKQFGEKHVIEFDGTWFMAFDWLEGASVFAPDITVEHCAKIGQVLGKIHGANVQIEGLTRNLEIREMFDWKNILERLNATEKEIMSEEKEKETIRKERGTLIPGEMQGCYEILVEFLPELLQIDTETVSALRELSSCQVISHRDLDPKNVMWQGTQPYLIDWEAAGYVNPYQELVEVLNYWVTEADGTYNYEKFHALLGGYAAGIDVKMVDWDVVLKGSFDGMLGWLEYSAKRAAGLLGENEADRIDGRKQGIDTIADIRRQKARMMQLKTWLCGYSAVQE